MNDPAAATTPCATCGACCRSYVVPVCGYDIWWITTRQRLSPEQYLVALSPSEVDASHFRLSAASGGADVAYALVLDKRGVGPFKRDKPCVFLVDLAGGHARCGIYAERPVVCQGYPMTIWENRVYQRKNVLCPPGAWPAEAAERPHWRAALRRYHMHFDIYHQVVARWNARVAARPSLTFTLLDYYSYLLNVYDRLDALATATGAEELARVEAGWPTPPLPPGAGGKILLRSGEVAWLDYLDRVRAVINTVYPEIPPQPLVLVMPTQEDMAPTAPAQPTPA